MRKIIKIVFAILFANNYSSQNVSFTPTIDIYPKTPDAAALSKHIDIPPGNYTGVADFTIPLYTIDIDGEKIPIQLQYTTTGVKVSEIASRVGLGWALSAGPHLSQQIMGEMDKRAERPVLKNLNNLNEPCEKGPIYPFTDPCGIALSAVGIQSFNNEVVYDQQPDIYSYNLLQGSGQFIMDYSGTFGIPRPFNMTKIKPVSIYGVRTDAIEMTDDKGNYYYFKNDYIMGIENTSSCDPKVMPIDIDYQPNYKIEKITFPNNKEINYLYTKSVNSSYVTSIMEQNYIDRYWVPYDTAGFDPMILPPDRCVNKTQLRDRALTQINFDEGKVMFHYNNDAEGFVENIRQDLSGEIYLTRVIVKDNSNHIVRDISLLYNYFTTNDPVPELYRNYSFSNSSDMFKRLKLTKVKDNLTNGEYELKYYGEEENQELPNRLSFSQDFWGVYNGKPNTSPVATVKTRKFLDTRVKVYLGADKQPDFNFGVTGNLKEIKYPTGGYTKITYEADDYKLFEDVGPVYGYQQEETELAYMDDTWVYFSIPDIVAQFSNSIEMYDSESPPGVPIPVTGSTPKWELQRQNTSGQYVNFSGNSAHIGTGSIPREDGAGNYRLRVYKPVDFKSPRVCYASYRWLNEFVVTNSNVRKTGNIRIKQIESNSTDAGKIIRKYSYINPEDSLSSGINHGEAQFVALRYQEFDLPRKLTPLGPGRYMQYLTRINNPGWQINTVRGKAVGYGHVQEIYESSLHPILNYKKEYVFKNDPNTVLYTPWSPINITWPLQDLDRGLLIAENLFNSNGEFVRQKINDYGYDYYFNKDATMNSFPTYTTGTIGKGYQFQIKKIDRTNSSVLGPTGFYFFNKADFDIKNVWIKNIKTKTTDFINNLPTKVTEQVQAYSNPPRHTFPISETLQNGNGDILNSQHYKYATEKTNTFLIDKNMISIPLETELKKNGLSTISKIETVYPTSQSDATNKTAGLPLPVSVATLDVEVGNMNTEILYKKYDLKGNLLQYIIKPDADENGIPVTIIWGYGKTQPVAKIEGAKLSDIANSVIADLENASKYGDPNYSEAALLVKLDKLRKDYPAFQITTYTYKPLVGVTTITPPSGIREIYSYDGANRLNEVRDVNGNILKEYQYHYKTP